MDEEAERCVRSGVTQALKARNKPEGEDAFPVTCWDRLIEEWERKQAV